MPDTPTAPEPQRLSTRSAITAVVAGLVFLVAAAGSVYAVAYDSRNGGSAVMAAAPPPEPLAAAIESAERRVASVPGDYTTWAELGTAYVEKARVAADPGYYQLADAALQESLRLRREGNDAALSGLGVLQNARHDFSSAADSGARAVAINPYSATAWGVLADARTQLGDLSGAAEAVARMVALRPGVASFARASYDAELSGDLDGARSALLQALVLARSPADEVFCRSLLGELALSAGDLDEARRQYAAGLVADLGNPDMLHVRARVHAARGEVDRAVADYQAVVDARPLPEDVVEFGDYLVSVGRQRAAQQQYARVDTLQRPYVENGVRDDLELALYAADHGDPATAVQAAQAEFARRQNAESSDALAWALHSAGRDTEALPLAQAATSVGGPNPLFLHHRGAIEAALGMTDQARTSLAAAVATNSYALPTVVPEARALLERLGRHP